MPRSGFRVDPILTKSRSNCNGQLGDPSFALGSIADSPYCAVVGIFGERIPSDFEAVQAQFSNVDALGAVR